jgi:hypothetical protein
VSYYGKEYAEYYRGIRGGNLNSGRNYGYSNSSANGYSRNYTRSKRKKWTNGIIQTFAIQTISIIFLGGIVYSLKFSERKELNNVFYSVKAVLSQDYYFKNNSIDFNLEEILDKINIKINTLKQ